MNHHQPEPSVSGRLLRLPAVENLSGLKKTTIYARMADKNDPFPVPVRLGGRAVAWREREVLAWIEGRAKTKLHNRLLGLHDIPKPCLVFCRIS